MKTILYVGEGFIIFNIKEKEKPRQISVWQWEISKFIIHGGEGTEKVRLTSLYRQIIQASHFVSANCLLKQIEIDGLEFLLVHFHILSFTMLASLEMVRRSIEVVQRAECYQTKTRSLDPELMGFLASRGGLKTPRSWIEWVHCTFLLAYSTVKGRKKNNSFWYSTNSKRT